MVDDESVRLLYDQTILICL
jgi:hypothetical protein